MRSSVRLGRHARNAACRAPRLLLARFALLALVLLVTGDARHARAQEDGARIDAPPPPPVAKQLTRAPELIESAAPIYPAEAAAAGLEGDVLLRITIDATGAITAVTVVTAAGHGFDEAAVDAVRQYRFRPAEFDGVPAPLRVETTIRFRLEELLLETPPEEPTNGANDSANDGATAGTSTIAGIAKERGTRRLLPGVTVLLVEAGLEAVTDGEGRFTLEQVPAGTHRLRALLAGYDRLDEAVTVAQNELATVTLYLRPRGGSPYETTVEAERERLEVTRHTISRRQMTTVPGTFGDPIRVLQNLPGLARTPYVLGILVIRGSNPDDSAVYIDGHRVPLLYHFLGGPSVLNPEFLDSVALYPGGFPARFGRAIGGVVEIETRKPKRDGVHGAADVDLIDTSLYLRAPLGPRVTVAVAARRSYVDAILPFFLPEPEVGSTLVVVPVYWDYQARIDVDLPGRDELSVLVIGSSDVLDVLASDAESSFDLGTSIAFKRLRATYKTPLSGKLTLELSPIIGLDEISFSGGEAFSFKAQERTIGLRERVRGELPSGVTLDTGLDLQERKTRYDLVAPLGDDLRGNGGGGGGGGGDNDPERESEAVTREVDIYSLGGWVELGWRPHPTVRVVPSLRIDGYLLAGEPRVSADPRLAVRWQTAPATTLKSYLGLFHQPPRPEAFDAEFGNPDLLVERAVQTGFGVEHRLTRAISVESEVYYAARSDQVVNVPDVVMNPDGTIEPLFWKNEQVGRSYGLELLVRHEVTRNFFGWLSYTLSRAEEQRHPGDAWTPTNFDGTHNAVAVASYRTDGGWELGLRFRAATGRPETPIIGSTFDADSDQYAPLTGEQRSGRRAFFHQLDLRAEKTFTMKTWRLSAYLDVLNVYNAENPEATQWDYRYRDSAPIRGLPIVPTLGVKGEW